MSKMSKHPSVKPFISDTPITLQNLNFHVSVDMYFYILMIFWSLSYASFVETTSAAERLFLRCLKLLL